MEWNYLSIPKLQRLHRWSLGMDKQFHPTHYWVCDYLSMLGLKLNHVSKRGPWYSHWDFLLWKYGNFTEPHMSFLSNILLQNQYEYMWRIFISSSINISLRIAENGDEYRSTWNSKVNLPSSTANQQTRWATSMNMGRHGKEILPHYWPFVR